MNQVKECDYAMKHLALIISVVGATRLSPSGQLTGSLTAHSSALERSLNWNEIDFVNSITPTIDPNCP